MQTVIVTYRKYHDLDRLEISPQVYEVPRGIAPEDYLQEIWQKEVDAFIYEAEETNDPLDADGCWCEECMAQIGWTDGDIKEFYIADVENWR